MKPPPSLTHAEVSHEEFPDKILLLKLKNWLISPFECYTIVIQLYLIWSLSLSLFKAAESTTFYTVML